MSVIEELNQEGAQDLERAKNFLTAVELLSYAVGQLTGLGYRPTLQRTSGGLISLAVDLSAVDPGHLSTPVCRPIEVVATPPSEDEASSSAPAADPEPKRQAEPKVPQPPKTKALSAAEKAEAIDLLAAGAGTAEVARKLGRITKQLANLKSRSKDLITARAAELARNTPVEKGESAMAGTKDRSPPTRAIRAPIGSDSYSGLTSVEKMINAHLNALGYADGWTPGDDLALVEELVRGNGPDVAAAKFKVSPGTVIARWKALNTTPGSLDHQARLVRVLKLRAGNTRPLAAE